MLSLPVMDFPLRWILAVDAVDRMCSLPSTMPALARPLNLAADAGDWVTKYWHQTRSGGGVSALRRVSRCDIIASQLCDGLELQVNASPGPLLLAFKMNDKIRNSLPQPMASGGRVTLQGSELVRDEC